MLGDRRAQRVQLAQLEEVGDAPVDALELRLAVARLGGGADQLVGDGEPLLRVRGAPQRDVAGVERLEQRAPARRRPPASASALRPSRTVTGAS